MAKSTFGCPDPCPGGEYAYAPHFKATTALSRTYLPDPIPTLPLEKDGQQRIMRDMWLEGEIEDTLLALAQELGWLRDLSRYSKQMGLASQQKLKLALASAGIRGIGGGIGGGGGASRSPRNRSKRRRAKKFRLRKPPKPPESAGAPDPAKGPGDCISTQMKGIVSAVARLILSGKCQRIAFLTGAGCSVGAGANAALSVHQYNLVSWWLPWSWGLMVVVCVYV